MMAMQEHRPPGHKASMMIGGPDKVESARQEKAVKRKKLVADRSLRKTQREKEHEVELENRVEEHKELYEDGGEVEDEKVEDEEVQKGEKNKRSSKNILPLPQTALAAVSTQPSNRQSAAISTGQGHIFLGIPEWVIPVNN